MTRQLQSTFSRKWDLLPCPMKEKVKKAKNQGTIPMNLLISASQLLRKKTTRHQLRINGPKSKIKTKFLAKTRVFQARKTVQSLPLMAPALHPIVRKMLTLFNQSRSWGSRKYCLASTRKLDSLIQSLNAPYFLQITSKLNTYRRSTRKTRLS